MTHQGTYKDLPAPFRPTAPFQPAFRSSVGREIDG